MYLNVTATVSHIPDLSYMQHTKRQVELFEMRSFTLFITVFSSETSIAEEQNGLYETVN